MAFPGLVAASNLADAENKEAVWDNLGNNINAVILATNSIRNNTMVGAVAGTPGVLPTFWEGTESEDGITREIVGVGAEDGIPYIDIKYSGTPATLNSLFINFELLDEIFASAGQVWSISTYAQLVSGNFTGANPQLRMRSRDADLQLTDLSSQSLTAGGSNLRLSRQGFSAAISNPTSVYVVPFIRVFLSTGVPIDFTLRIGMPQLERGEYITPPIATTNAPASALATVSLALEGDDILELTGVRIASVADFVRIKGLATPAQPRLTIAAANAGSGIALRDDALAKASPSSEGDFFITRGTLDGQSLRVNGLAIASISGSPFSGSTASCPLSISSFAAPTNLRLNNAMTSGTLAFPEKAIPIETNDFILYAKAGQG
jgi:hypothetical protein